MIFTWLRRRRRRKLLETPFPPEWLGYLQQNMAHYPLLSEAEQARLRDDLRIFIAEKTWEGCGGLRMTDEIKVTIAAQACLLLPGAGARLLRPRDQSILIYPHGYRAPAPEMANAGACIDAASDRLGEAHYRGPVMLSWDRRPGGRRGIPAAARTWSSTSSPTSSTCSTASSTARRPCTIRSSTGAGRKS